MVYSLGIPKQTETAKAKHSILVCSKKKGTQGHFFFLMSPICCFGRKKRKDLQSFVGGRGVLLPN